MGTPPVETTTTPATPPSRTSEKPDSHRMTSSFIQRDPNGQVIQKIVSKKLEKGSATTAERLAAGQLQQGRSARDPTPKQLLRLLRKLPKNLKRNFVLLNNRRTQTRTKQE